MSDVVGFTPVFDSVTQDTDAIASYVYGRVRRYAQGKQGKCTASIAKIAKEVGYSTKTVERRLKILVDNDWLVDLTPERRNKPHEYITTGRTKIIAVAKTDSRTGTSESLRGASQSRSHTDRESDEDTIKKEVKKQEKNLKDSPHLSLYSEMREEWKRLFPDKPQPRKTNRPLQKQVKTRMGDEGFMEEWKTAMLHASESPTCQSDHESWFNFGYFVRTEETWNNCLNRWMEWKDKDLRGDPHTRIYAQPPVEELKAQVEKAQAEVSKDE